MPLERLINLNLSCSCFLNTCQVLLLYKFLTGYNLESSHNGSCNSCLYIVEYSWYNSQRVVNFRASNIKGQIACRQRTHFLLRNCLNLSLYSHYSEVQLILFFTGTTGHWPMGTKVAEEVVWLFTRDPKPTGSNLMLSTMSQLLWCQR